MKFPNKVTSYEESILSKLCPILNELAQKDMLVYEVYSATKDNYEDSSVFIDCLDCLFALNKIEFLSNLEVLHYVV